MAEGNSTVTVKVEVNGLNVAKAVDSEASSDDLETGNDEVQKSSKSSVSNRMHVVKSADGTEKREIVCVAMVANEVDAHGDAWTVEAVENAAADFLTDYNLTKEIGADHSGERPDIDLIGSWYTQEGGQFDGYEVPEFSWVTKMRVNDDEKWEGVKKGLYTGLSVEGDCEYLEVKKSKTDKIAKSASSDDVVKPKRVLVKANLTNLDLVDEGANLKTLVWKSKENPMTTETDNKIEDQGADSEVISTEVEKSKAPEGGNPAATPSNEDPASEPVAKSTEEPGLELVAEPVDVIGALEAVLAKAKNAPDKAAIEKARDALSALLDPKPEAEVSEPEPAPVAKSKGEPTAGEVATISALEAIAKNLAGLNERMTELEEARGASAGGGDDDGSATISEDRLAKRKGTFSVDMSNAFAPAE